MDVRPPDVAYSAFMVKHRPHLAIAALLVCVTVSVPIATSSSAYADDAGVLIVPAAPDAADTPVAAPAPAPAGSGSDVATPPASSPPATAPVTAESSDGTLAQTLWSAIQSKDWFLAVGAALALLIHGVRWLLKKKWPSFEKDRWGWFLAAGLAGVVALSTAWLAGKDAASSHTLIGALKILAAAIATYVTTKKLAPAEPEPA